MKFTHCSNQIAWYLAGAALCLLLTACSKTPQSVAALPELPTELAADLVMAKTAPVLMTGPVSGPLSTPVSAPPVALDIAKGCTTSYDGYVLFPITVCYLPPLPELSTIPPPVLAKKIPGVAEIPVTKFFKLSSHAKNRLKHPLFCSVRSGPWYAHVEAEQKCGTNPNILSFTAGILGAPEPINVTWSGQLSDVPPPLVLTGITESGTVCQCCSGSTCPDGTCKPSVDMCGVMPPAIK